VFHAIERGPSSQGDGDPDRRDRRRADLADSAECGEFVGADPRAMTTPTNHTTATIAVARRGGSHVIRARLALVRASAGSSHAKAIERVVDASNAGTPIAMIATTSTVAARIATSRRPRIGVANCASYIGSALGP